jgi:hypothetical protein
MAQIAIDAARAQLDLGEITKAEYLRKKQEQYDAEYKALLDEIARERKALAAENLPPGDELDRRKATINKQEQEGTDKYKTKTAGNQTDEVANATAGAKQVIDPIFQGFDTGIKEMISGTKTFGQAWADMGKKMVTGFADTMIKLGLQWAQRQVEDLAVHKAEQAGLVTIDKGYAAAHQITGIGISAADKTQQTIRTATAKVGLATNAADDKIAAASHEIVSGGVTASDAGEQIKQTGAAVIGDQTRLASTVTSSGEGLAVQRADGIASRLEAAKTAAANTWASVSAIPVIGYILAPIAAAAAFAAVAAFETGGDVGGTGLALLHENEHVINAPLTKMLQHAATQPNAGGGGGGGGGGNTYHVNSSPTVHVHSEADGAKLLSDHADHIGRIVQQQSRKFNR